MKSIESAKDGLVQLIEAFEVSVVDRSLLRSLPYHFDGVELGRVCWQEVKFNSCLVFLQPALEILRMVVSNVVQDHVDLLMGMTTNDLPHESSKCLQIEDNVPLTIVSASRHNPIKGNDLLIRAVAELKKWKIPIKALIYGHGKLTEDLQALATKLGVEKQITFPRQA